MRMSRIKLITINLCFLLSIKTQGQTYFKGFNTKPKKPKKEQLIDSINNVKKTRYKNKIISLTIQLDSLENYLLHKDYLFSKAKIEYQKELLKKPGKKDIKFYDRFDSIFKLRDSLKIIYYENIETHPKVASLNNATIERLSFNLNSIKDSIRYSKKMPTDQVKNELFILEKKQNSFYNIMTNKIKENKALTDLYKDSLLLIFRKNHKIRKLKKKLYKPEGLPKVAQNPLKNSLTITSDYGDRVHPILKKHHFHYGIDLRGKYKNVYSVLPGIVSKVGYDKKLGIFVEVSHDNGLKTIYGHLSKFFVLEETIINMNKPIGVTGTTGQSTAPHLHFAVKFKNKFINPKHLLR